MCGVIGAIGFDLAQQDVDRLQHRGPDFSAFLPTTIGQHKLWLAHTRLAIQDLNPSGNQPMWSAGKHALMSYNGEIYNHSSLREKLPQLTFKGNGDSETLVNYLADFSADKLNDLNGIFSFALALPAQNKVVLARDPFGVKPLYYAQTNKGIVFSSELKSILPFVDKQVNKSALATLLQLRYVPSPLTLFEGIYKLRPGHYLTIDCSSTEPKLVEQPYAQVTDTVSAAPQDTAHFSQLFETVVDRQMLSDVEVGIFLSGGVDSALVAALAQQKAPHPLKAFTIGFEGKSEACEIDDAAETARILGLEHHVLRLGGDDYIAQLQKAVNIVEEPLATTSVVPFNALSQLAAEHVKVVLSGQGADESMGGYARYWAEWLGGHLPRGTYRLAERLGLGNSKNSQLNRAVRSLSEPNDIDRFLKVYSVFSENDIAQLTGLTDSAAKALVTYSYDLLNLANRAQSVERMMSLDLRMGLSDDLLLYTDKITMAHSLECRVPMLDIELVQALEALPSVQRVNLLGGKQILKKYAQQVLPDTIIKRKKRGFTSPTRAWLKDRQLLMNLLCEDNGAFSNYFAKEALVKVIDEYLDGFRPDTHVFLLLSIKLWFASYFDE